jgi:hypothetical protein
MAELPYRSVTMAVWVKGRKPHRDHIRRLTAQS